MDQDDTRSTARIKELKQVQVKQGLAETKPQTKPKTKPGLNPEGYPRTNPREN